jgi:hypothetical protein
MRAAALLVAASVVVGAGCGQGQVEPTSSVVESANPAPCAIAQPPGPADEPPRDGGDLIDTTDWGGGRWRLCLVDPERVDLEGTAWCTWDEARAAVVEVNGLPIEAGRLAFDAGLSFSAEPPEFYFHTTETSQGLIANYRSLHSTVTPEAAASSGVATFEVALQPDPEAGAPPGSEPGYRGVFRWRCGAAPPPG